MSNHRKNEAFHKIHMLWVENYNFIAIPFKNISKEEEKKKIIEILSEMIGKKYHLNDQDDIKNAIKEVMYYRKLQIIALNRISNDTRIFKKELNENSKSLIGLETIRLYEHANYDMKNAVSMLSNDIKSPNSPFKIHFDAIYKTQDKLLDAMIHLNKAKANSQVICKLTKMVNKTLNKMLHQS